MVTGVERHRMDFPTSQAGGDALRKVPVHVRDYEVGDGFVFTEVPCRDGTDRSGPDQENVGRAGPDDVEPRNPTGRRRSMSFPERGR